MQSEEVVQFAGGSLEENNEIWTVVLKFKIKDGFHIQSFNPKEENLIPTRVELDIPTDFKILKTEHSATQPFQLEGTALVFEVFTDSLTLKMMLDGKWVNKGGEGVKGELFYQACDQRKCYYPKSETFIFKPDARMK